MSIPREVPPKVHGKSKVELCEKCGFWPASVESLPCPLADAFSKYVECRCCEKCGYQCFLDS